MKITSFNPMIVTKNAEDAVKVFEALGFEKRHNPTVGVKTEKVATTRLKDANGFYIDIVQSDTIGQDLTEIRMNVDDFDEAYNLLMSHGFQHLSENGIVDTGSAKAVGLKSPSGYVVSIVHHIKK